MIDYIFSAVMFTAPSICAFAVYKLADDMIDGVIQKYRNDIHVAEQKILLLERQNEEICIANEEWYDKVETMTRDYEAVQASMLETRNLFIMISAALAILVCISAGAIYLTVLMHNV